MTKTELIKKAAELKMENDHLMTEILYLDHLMRMVGFADGINTVKATAREIHARENLKKHKKVDPIEDE